MKRLKLLAALLALTIGLAGCGKGSSASSSKPEKMLDGDNMIASPSAKQEYTEPEDVTYMRLLAGEDEYRACVLYLGGSYEITTDVQQVLDSQQGLRELWGFVYDIPQDHWVVAPDGGCDLYCIFPQEAQATLSVYETSLTDDAEKPLQRGKQLYYSEDGQPILLLCNISDIVPNTEVELYPSTGEELVFSPFLSGENGHVVQADGVCDFTIYPEGDDWETDTSPWSLEGNWLEIYRDTDEGVFDTDPADADRMCFLPTDADTEGSQLRAYFVARPGCVLVDADYSQIELRILAHVTGDEHMQQAFLTGEDIHRSTAAKIYDLPLEQVTPRLRSSAKAINFGIMYGKGAYSLSKDIGVSVKEADAFLKNYLATFPKVSGYMDKTISDARNCGYVSTLFGRRRSLPELASNNHNIRASGERMARNTPIQGTAADVIKLAMVRVWRRLRDEKMESRLILTVHDELIVEAPEAEAAKAAAILQEEMEGCVNYAVPLSTEVHQGKNWLEAH